MPLLTTLLVAFTLKGADRQPLNVFAAASLQAPFQLIAREYEATHPLVAVHLSFAGSQALAAQIARGAPADVFASASQKNLDSVVYDRISRRVFAGNQIALVLRKGLHGIESPRDLWKAGRFILANPAVPIGAYAEIFLRKAAKMYGAKWDREVRSHIGSRELDDSAIVSKIKLGEGDAAIVYRSDVVLSKLVAVPIPRPLGVGAEYPVAVPSSSRNKKEGAEFIRFLLSSVSQKILHTAGFSRSAR